MDKLGPYLLGPNDENQGIYTGDARELTKAIPDESVDCIVTDPPFKLSQTYTANVDADNLSAVSSIWPMAHALFRVAKPGAYFAMYYDTRILPLALEAMRWAGWKYLRGLTFYRRWGNANKLYGWMSTSDFILLFRKPTDGPFKFYSDDWRHDVYIKIGPEEFDGGHKAQKPVLDVLHLVTHLTPPNGLVIDPYCGTGTTLVAANGAECQWLAFEIDPPTADLARKRVQQTQPPLFVPQPEQISMELTA